MRISAVALLALALVAPAGATVRSAALPADVRDGLAKLCSIEVGPPAGAPAQLPISATRAKQLVKRQFSVRGHSIGVYLVRITGHPGLFDPLPPGHGWTSIAPLQVGDLAWIVVVRGAPIPFTRARGAPVSIVKETLVVIVETKQPRDVGGITIAQAGS